MAAKTIKYSLLNVFSVNHKSKLKFITSSHFTRKMTNFQSILLFTDSFFASCINYSTQLTN